MQVLDMCAAPGSKTAQLVEFLHADESVAVPGEFLGIGNTGCGKDCVFTPSHVFSLQRDLLLPTTATTSGVT